MKEMAIAIGGDSLDRGLRDLNEHLEHGWKVKSMCPMPSSVGGDSAGSYRPSCLVIIKADVE